MNEERRYNVWAGNPKGLREDKTKCIEEVHETSGWLSYQCQRKRGFGPNGEYCKQHAKRQERIASLYPKVEQEKKQE